MALFDRLGFGHRLDVSAYFGIVLGFVGLAFLFEVPSRRGSIDRLGALVIVLSAMCWAAGSLYSRGAPLRGARSSPPASFRCVESSLLAGYATVSGELGEAVWTQEAVLALGYLIVVGSFVGFTAYVWLLRSAPTSASRRPTPM